MHECFFQCLLLFSFGKRFGVSPRKKNGSLPVPYTAHQAENVNKITRIKIIYDSTYTTRHLDIGRLSLNFLNRNYDIKRYMNRKAQMFDSNILKSRYKC